MDHLIPARPYLQRGWERINEVNPVLSGNISWYVVKEVVLDHLIPARPYLQRGWERINEVNPVLSGRSTWPLTKEINTALHSNAGFVFAKGNAKDQRS